MNRAKIFTFAAAVLAATIFTLPVSAADHGGATAYNAEVVSFTVAHLGTSAIYALSETDTKRDVVTLARNPVTLPAICRTHSLRGQRLRSPLALGSPRASHYAILRPGWRA